MVGKTYGHKEKGIYINVKADGIYLVLDNRINRDKNLAKNPAPLVEGTGMRDVDPEVLKSAFNRTDEDVEVKISNHTHINIKDESLHLEVSKDLMEVSVAFIPGNPWFGAQMTAIEIANHLKESGVTFGVLTDVLTLLQTERPPSGRRIKVAAGRPPAHGENGRLQYSFDVEKQGNTPKVLENGNVDFKNIDTILKAAKGDVLVEVVDPKPGTDGVNVKGGKVTHKLGKPAPRLPKGKNTTISEDERQLIADIDGQIQINGGRVDIAPILVIPGDVGYTTGNIEFTGSVYVEGTILTGFFVNATGDVDVKGAVEGANIEAVGNVNLIGGIKGVGKSVIKAGGNIFARYVERATLEAGGDITSDSVMHSDIRCGGNLLVEGKKGLLVGGVIYAGKSVTAKMIGSSMATATEITVGSSPDFVVRYNELEEMYKKIKSDYDKERLVESFKSGNEDLKLRSLHARIHLRVEMDKIQKEMNELLVLLNSKEGVVRASQVIHCGCSIIVGGVLIKVKDELYSCTLRNKEERVHVSPYISY